MRSAHSRRVRPTKTIPLLFGLATCITTSARTQQLIPLRRLTDIVASDSGVFSSVLGVRGLPLGRVLVNDWERRRLIALDSTMKRITAITDSVPGAGTSYGINAAFIVPYTRDSTLFIIQQARVFVVLDPYGRPVRTMAPPRAQDYSPVMTGAGSKSAVGYDPSGRLVYEAPLILPPIPDSAKRLKAGQIFVRTYAESTAILRVDPFSRKVDTLGRLGQRFTKMLLEADGAGDFSQRCQATNPLPVFDQWTLMPDGTVAILRAANYHIDWIRDGKITPTAKMPFAWRPVSDSAKQAIIDSTRAALEPRLARVPARAMGIGGVVRETKPCPFRSIDPSEFPDYYPPNPPQGRRGFFADRDGNLWILPATSSVAAEGLVFDMVNRQGEIFQRVVIPPGRYIAGFGPDGAVYLESLYAPGVPRLERARVAKQ